MWFKNLIVYQFTQPFSVTAESLEAYLLEKLFNSCGSQDFSSYGWVPALGSGTNALVHQSSNCFLIKACQEEKILPASVIKDALETKVEAIEREECREVFSKEKKALKDDIVMELLPKAFTKKTYTLAYIDLTAQLLIVNASSFTQAEKLTSYLRECLGSLPVTMPTIKNLPSTSMTQWLSSELVPAPFALGSECELREPGDEGAKIKAFHQELTSEEIKAHVESGMQACKVGVQWDDSLTCTIRDDLVIQKLKFTDLIQEQLDDIEIETKVEQMDASFGIMVGTLRRFYGNLFEAFGGREEAAHG
ncbi:recombination-associated protein RdgC [Endozoicomonas arenosclerae]|uniref:recombination-associated protein RdgC n=1 Tax=Endozoicomonas arenosclerae TaxID=1633495 RepID=UPI0007819575|nr:recombination-associated protein RdgC [Endozoicomonas arenosclerae]